MKRKTRIICASIVGVILVGLIYLINKELPNVKKYKEIRETNNDIIEKVVTYPKEDSSELDIDWEELLNINKDIIAWIYIPDTYINYPILKGKTNDEYLYTNIYKCYSQGGSIFADFKNSSVFEDINTILYGHNLYSNDMFSNLAKYTDYNFFKEHQYIYIYLPTGEKKVYKVYSFHIVRFNDELYDLENMDKDDLVKKTLKNNMLEDDFNESEITKILTLSTCTNINKYDRYLLHAYLV